MSTAVFNIFGSSEEVIFFIFIKFLMAAKLEVFVLVRVTVNAALGQVLILDWTTATRVSVNAALFCVLGGLE